MAVPGEKGAAKPRKRRKKSASRPDEMTPEVFEFLTAVDDYKRAHMRSFLGLEELLEVFEELGYQPQPDGHGDELALLSEAIAEYKREQQRLFPSWSEIFRVARELGWARNAT